jgi:hypothetical protein
MNWWIAIALVGCKGGGTEDTGPVDLRIDGSPVNDESDASGTRMCADGDALSVVWSDAREGVEAVFFNHSDDRGQSWMPRVVQLSHGSKAATAPDVACGDGAVYVAWEDASDGELENHDIYVSTSSDAGSTWSDEVAIDGDADGDHMSLGPRVAVAGSDVVVAWFDATFGAYDIEVAASHDGGVHWHDPVRAESDPAGATYSAWPQVAVQAGKVYVAWEDSRDGGSDVYFATSADAGDTFTPDQRLDGGNPRGASDSFAPRLAADGDTVYVVWHDERNGDGRDILMNFSTDAGTTFAAEAIRVDSDGPGYFDSLYPDVAVAGNTAHFVWQDARSIGFDVYYRQANGADFTAEEVRLDTDGAGLANSINPRIAIDGDDVVAAWQDRRDDSEGQGYDDLYYNFSGDGGGTWADNDLRIDRVQSGSKFAHDLNVRVESGEILAAWTDGRNGNADVFFHALPLGEESPPVLASE